jgi:hypothetical protein
MEAGIGMDKGTQIYNRIRVDDGKGQGGEFFIRTRLDERETLLLRNVMKTPQDLVIAAFRMPSYSGEMVDLARRNLKEALRESLGVDITGVPMTGRHSFEGSVEREETILLALAPHPEMNDALPTNWESPVSLMGSSCLGWDPWNCKATGRPERFGGESYLNPNTGLTSLLGATGTMIQT